jgi:hypothetical protein
VDELTRESAQEKAGSLVTSQAACATELGPRLSYLGAVLAVVDHIPRDQRPAQRRDEPERGQRRQRQAAPYARPGVTHR